MKSVLWAVLILLLAATSCKKEEVANTSTKDNTAVLTTAADSTMNQKGAKKTSITIYYTCFGHANSLKRTSTRS